MAMLSSAEVPAAAGTAPPDAELLRRWRRGELRDRLAARERVHQYRADGCTVQFFDLSQR